VEDVSPWALVLYEAVWAYAFAAHTYLGDATDRNTLPSFLDHLRNIETPGVNGPLQLNEQGDRVGVYEWVNMNYGADHEPNEEGKYWEPIFDWSQTNSVHNEVGSIVFTGGATQPPPDTLVAVQELQQSIPTEVLAGVGAGVVALIVMIVVYFKRQSWKVSAKNEEERSARNRQIHVLEAKLDWMALTGYGVSEKAMIKSLKDKFEQELEAGGGGEGDAGEKRRKSVVAHLMIVGKELVGDEKIGKGAFGEVVKATYRGALVAVKTMKTVDEKNIMKFKDEIIMTQDLYHENIVRMIGCVWEESLCALVLEFCANGNAHDLMKKTASSLSVRALRRARRAQ